MVRNVNIFLDKKIFLNIIINMDVINLMTIDDLSDYLKVSRRTIYEWLKQNKIPAVKLVGQWRFRKEKIDSWMEGHSSAGGGSACG